MPLNEGDDPFFSTWTFRIRKADFRLVTCLRCEKCFKGAIYRRLCLKCRKHLRGREWEQEKKGKRE